MAENKTVAKNTSVDEFLASIANEKRRYDAGIVLDIMKKVTGLEPVMWGSSLIGFDAYHYKYESGREGDSFMTGCSPRKQNLAIYVMPGFKPYSELLNKLGKHKTGASCLYINKLEDVDLSVLEELISRSYKDMQSKYPYKG